MHSSLAAILRRFRCAAPKHRHAVVFPLFLCAALLPVVATHLTASILDAHKNAWQTADQPQTVTVANNMVVLQPHSLLVYNDGVLSLTSGSAIVAAPGLVTVRAGSFDVLGWNGAFSVTVAGDSMTVAGITAPVLVRSPAARILVPAGFQWKGEGEMEPFSADAVRSQLPVRLPASYLTIALRTVLALPVSDVDTDVPDIALADRHSIDRARLAQWFFSDPDRWLLGSIHPAMSALAWTMDAPEGTPDDGMFLRIFALPLADGEREALPAVTVDRWVDTAAAVLPKHDHLSENLTLLISIVAHQLQQMEEEGNSERAHRWRTAASELVTHLSLFLAPAQADQLQASLLPAAYEPVTSVPEPSEPVPPLVVSADDPEALNGARTVLQRLGAMFTAKTTMAGASSAVRVTDVVFPTASGDEVFSLTVNLTAGTISDIDRSGRLYPNAVTYGQFGGWVQ